LYATALNKKSMITILKVLKPQNYRVFTKFLLGLRPIAFASTMDENGNANVSPFSFFNVF
jgi:flavin reductase (DIM6/NTAB) family NADH-FMN oxidoreductase RutF